MATARHISAGDEVPEDIFDLIETRRLNLIEVEEVNSTPVDSNFSLYK